MTSRIPNFRWKQALSAGGGFMMSLLESPTEPDVLYSRCDVGGVFRSRDGGRSWAAINSGCYKYHHHQVQSIALSPHAPNMLFRCAGAASDGQTYGDILKSDDHGENWRCVSSEADYLGNGGTRYYGELIQVDPFTADRVCAGSFSRGVFLSNDSGETWKCTGLEGEPIGCILMHPVRKNAIYVGTRRWFPHTDYLKLRSSRANGKGRLFRSSNGGVDWEMLYESEYYDFHMLAADFCDPQILYAASSTEIIRSCDGGQNFTPVLKSLLPEKGFLFVATHPALPEMVITARNRTIHLNAPNFPIMISRDKGDSWALNCDVQPDNVMGYPDYLPDIVHLGCGISRVLISRHDPKRWYLSNCYGILRSDDSGSNWNGFGFTGLATTCIENVQLNPARPRKTYYTCADVTAFSSEDDGASFRPLAKAQASEINNGTALIASRQRPDLVLVGLSGGAKKGAMMVRSEDGGKTWQAVWRIRPGVTVEALREDSHREGRFFAYLDGVLSEGAGVYRSDDWGASWMRLPGPFREDEGLTVPRRQRWVESELLPIVFWQQHNVCGANQLLACDPIQRDSLYVGEWTEGVFKSVDGGDSWTAITGNLPLGPQWDGLSTIVDLKCDPVRPGVLYAGLINEGLWRCEARGAKWEKVFPKDGRIFNASSVVVTGESELFVACEPLHHAPARSSVMYSPDRGETWHEISDPKLGAVRWKGIVVDPQSGTIVAVSNGNGCFRAARRSV